MGGDRQIDVRSQQIHHRLAGLPFALLLAASWVATADARPVQKTPTTSTFLLGAKDLHERRSTWELRPGLTRTHVERGSRFHGDSWTLSSQAVMTPSQVRQSRDCLRNAGLRPQIERFRGPGSGHRYRIVQGGAFPTAEVAAAALHNLPDICEMRVTNVQSEPSWKGGPWSYDLLVLDPHIYRGRLSVGHGPGLHTTSQRAREGQAGIAINGGFFVMLDEEGLPGTSAGISILEGQWRHEPTQHRPFLLLHGGERGEVEGRIVFTPPAMPAIHWNDGGTTALTGINRPPGPIRNCGGHGAATPSAPQHDVTCFNPDEVIAVSADVIAQLSPLAPLTALVHRDGKVTTDSPAPREGDIALVATGKGHTELMERIASGARATVDLTFSPDSAVYAVNGGPLLVRDGRAIDQGDAEGWAIDRSSTPARATFIHDWYNRRNPRTAVGVGHDGRLYFLVLDGREFDRPDGSNRLGSAGATIEELRTLMLSLGLRDAMGLDGGGSTTLVVDGQVVNHPSDEGGERPIGDAILFKDR